MASSSKPEVPMKNISDEMGMISCPILAASSGVLGGLLGATLGAFTGIFHHVEKLGSKEHLLQTARHMKSNSFKTSKSFALMGVVYAGVECALEKARAKRDIANTVAAACVTGATMSATAGPQAACVGCATFAAFSAIIEKLGGHLSGHPREHQTGLPRDNSNSSILRESSNTIEALSETQDQLT